MTYTYDEIQQLHLELQLHIALVVDTSTPDEEFLRITRSLEVLLKLALRAVDIPKRKSIKSNIPPHLLLKI